MDNNSVGGARRLVFAPGAGPPGDTLVLIQLRGGMDALHVVPPHANAELARLRPRLAVRSPGEVGGALDLDGTFGFHPAMAPALELFRSGRMAIVHACGSPDRTLSHFEAGRTLDRGVADGRTSSTGWLSRHLATTPSSRSAVRAVAIARTRPGVLAGAPETTVLRSLAEVRLDVPREWGDRFGLALSDLYAAGVDPVAAAGRETLALVRELGKLAGGNYRPDGGARYPAAKLGFDLKQVAQLIKAEVGLEAAVLEQDGWDSHADQVAGLGGLMASLAAGLAAFAADLGERMRRVTVVAVSEFGRRARENSGRGTDHGRATAMFVLGGEVAGGRVYGRWPGLQPDQLDGDGNVPVTTDNRDVLAEIVARRLGQSEVAKVFPGFVPRPLDLVR